MPKEDFIILNQIGKGSFASVFKCKRKTDNKQYAIKQVRIDKLKQKDKLNALNQIRLLASIKDRHIISYKQAFYDQDNGTLCIVMQYANQGDLKSKIKQHIKNKTNFKEIQIWKTAYHLLKGVKMLHDHKIIHRDIKSANIFLVDDVAKLGDMNVSKIMKADLATTQTGTPYYASPQIWNDQPYGIKSDIWSIGIVIYELCMLNLPFTASNFEDLYQRIQSGSYQKINSIYSQYLHELIKQLLTVDSKKRPTSVQLLKNSIFLDLQLKQKYILENSSEIELLSTIQMPKIYRFLNQKLPAAKYKDQTVKKQKEKRKTLISFDVLKNSISCKKLPSLTNIKSQNNILPIPSSTKNLINSQNFIKIQPKLQKMNSNKNIKANNIPLKIKNTLKEWQFNE